MNLMILSPGRRCELVKYFKQELNEEGKKVIALDMNQYAPALYFADKFYVIKKDFDNLEAYVESVIKICKKERVSFLLTLIDPELGLLSKYRERFTENNINLILSGDECIKSTLNKCLFYSAYRNKLSLIKTYNNYQEIVGEIKKGKLNYPVFAKLIRGSASIGVHKINSEEELKICDNQKYIYQEAIVGKEIGIDAYFDMINGEIVSVFMKEKLAMRSGETDKSISLFRKDILKQLEKIKECGDYRGPIDIDMFITKNGKIYVNEINPRFGGGYAHAHYCGVNFIKLMVNNMNGIENKMDIGNYKFNVTMMKANRFIFNDEGFTYER